MKEVIKLYQNEIYLPNYMVPHSRRPYSLHILVLFILQRDYFVSNLAKTSSIHVKTSVQYTRIREVIFSAQHNLKTSALTYIKLMYIKCSLDGTVQQLIMWWMTDRVRFWILVWSRILSSPSHIPVLGLAQPPFQWVLRPLFSRVKRLRHAADHPPLISAKVKIRWIYTSTSHTPSWCSA
jgi:hypothetical protein